MSSRPTSHLTDFDRAGKITSSVVGAILRIDPSHSRKWAWRVITGREPERDAMDLARGKEHEVDALASFECQTGILLDGDGSFVSHPSIDWLGASPDDRYRDESGRLVVVEAKCPRVLHTAVPPMYYAQMQVQMECADAAYGMFVSWTEEGSWIQQVERSWNWWDENFPILEDFYEKYVLLDIEPPRSERRSKKNAV